MKWRSPWLLLLPIFLLLAACNSSDSDDDTIEQVNTPTSEVALRAVQNCDALKQRYVDNWVENLLS